MELARGPIKGQVIAYELGKYPLDPRVGVSVMVASVDNCHEWLVIGYSYERCPQEVELGFLTSPRVCVMS